MATKAKNKSLCITSDPLVQIQINDTQMFLIDQIYNAPCSLYHHLPKLLKWFHSASNNSGTWFRAIIFLSCLHSIYTFTEEARSPYQHQLLISLHSTYLKTIVWCSRPWADHRPASPVRNFVHYNFLKLHYIRHKIKDISPLRVAALTCNITLYTLPPK